MLVFNFWGIVFNFIKNIYFKIIFIICSALHNIYFILFNQFYMCLYLYYLLLMLINKFSKYKQINILFYKIKYFNLHHSFLIIINDRALKRLRKRSCNYGMERSLVACLSLLQWTTKLSCLSLNWKGVKDSDFQHE